MAIQSTPSGRVFKSSGFAKLARKADIEDEELCTAIRQVMYGRGDNLGGGVFKKRLNKTCTAASSSRRVGATGYMSICSRRKTAMKVKDLTEICYGDQA